MSVKTIDGKEYKVFEEYYEDITPVEKRARMVKSIIAIAIYIAIMFFLTSIFGSILIEIMASRSHIEIGQMSTNIRIVQDMVTSNPRAPFATLVELLKDTFLDQTTFYVKTYFTLNSWLNFLTYIALATVLTIFLFKVLKADFIEVKETINKKVILKILLCFGLFYGLSIFGSMLEQILCNIFNLPLESSNNQAIIQNMSKSGVAYLIVLEVIFFAPLVEELIFRKSVFALGAGSKKFDILALILSTFLFGILHTSTEASIGLFIVRTVPYWSAGFGLGLVYLINKKNIWSTIVIHMLNNLISMIIIFLN